MMPLPIDRPAPTVPMPPTPPHDRPADDAARDPRGWFRRLIDRLRGRDPEFDRAQAEIDRIADKVRERHARGTRRTSDPPV